MTAEKARAILILYYNIDNPTAAQIAQFLLFNKI